MVKFHVSQTIDQFLYFLHCPKFFEYVILDQLTDYLIKNNILCSEQFGFGSGYSTELAALRLIDRMISHLDAGRIPLNIYIAQSTELVSLYIGYWTLNNYYYYY